MPDIQNLLQSSLIRQELRPGAIRIPGGMHYGPRFQLPAPHKQLTVDSAMPDVGMSTFRIVRGVFLGRGRTFDMSWRATAYVKKLTEHPDGTPLQAREKLVLFVLADYHNDDRNCAWAGLTAIARDSLTSRRHIQRLVDYLEARGTIRIKRRNRETNLYYFTGLPKETASRPSKAASRPSKAASRPRDTVSPPLGTELCPHPRDTAMSPEPPLNRQDSKAEEAAAAFDAIGFDRPFGQIKFQTVWLRKYGEKGEWLTQAMEDTIQECQAKNIGVPPQFYGAKHDIEEREKVEFERRHHRTPL